jgi:hypothetical protein
VELLDDFKAEGTRPKLIISFLQSLTVMRILAQKRYVSYPASFDING